VAELLGGAAQVTLPAADADGRVRLEVVWAALDCPSGIAAAGGAAS
jgi:hypothetical protein